MLTAPEPPAGSLVSSGHRTESPLAPTKAVSSLVCKAASPLPAQTASLTSSQRNEKPPNRDVVHLLPNPTLTCTTLWLYYIQRIGQLSNRSITEPSHQPQRNPLRVKHSLPILPCPCPQLRQPRVYCMSLHTCLFWTFHQHGVAEHMAFVTGCFSERFQGAPMLCQVSMTPSWGCSTL